MSKIKSSKNIQINQKVEDVGDVTINTSTDMIESESKDDILQRQLLTKEFKIAISELVKIQLETFDKSIKRVEKVLIDMERQHQGYMEEIIFKYSEVQNRIESWEEQFYYIFHNIKKNQFDYMHYPDACIKSYEDIKNVMKIENAVMERLIQETRSGI